MQPSPIIDYLPITYPPATPLANLYVFTCITEAPIIIIANITLTHYPCNALLFIAPAGGFLSEVEE